MGLIKYRRFGHYPGLIDNCGYGDVLKQVDVEPVCLHDNPNTEPMLILRSYEVIPGSKLSGQRTIVLTMVGAQMLLADLANLINQGANTND